MPSVREATVGVGNNKYPFPMVRRAKGGSGKHFPFRIIPDLGQVMQDDLHAAGEQPAYIFDDGGPGAAFPDTPCELFP